MEITEVAQTSGEYMSLLFLLHLELAKQIIWLFDYLVSAPFSLKASCSSPKSAVILVLSSSCAAALPKSLGRTTKEEPQRLLRERRPPQVSTTKDFPPPPLSLRKTTHRCWRWGWGSWRCPGSSRRQRRQSPGSELPKNQSTWHFLAFSSPPNICL